MTMARALARSGRRGLHVFGVLNGLEADLLIGAGAVASTNTSYLGLDELGQAPYFQAAVRRGTIEVHEYTEWLVTAGFRAAEMDLPFIPWTTGHHSDVVRELGLETVACPYTGRELIAAPAHRLDVAVILARRCDSHGNVARTSPPDYLHDVDPLIARAADVVVVCAEEVGPVAAEEVELPGIEVTAVVHTPRGGWPGGLPGVYAVDRAHIVGAYLPAARGGGYDDYIAEFGS